MRLDVVGVKGHQVEVGQSVLRQFKSLIEKLAIFGEEGRRRRNKGRE